MDSLELRAKTVIQNINWIELKMKNQLFEPKFWFGPCRSKKSLSDQHNRFPGFPMYRGFNLGGGSKWFWDFDDYARGLFECGTAQLSLLSFVLYSYCSKNVAFVMLIQLNDLLDNIILLFSIQRKPRKNLQTHTHTQDGWIEKWLTEWGCPR